MSEIQNDENAITFLDVDENPLRLWLATDRIQLHVIDCRPGLDAGELRRFARVLFAGYLGGELAEQLDAARAALAVAVERGGRDPAAERALAAVARVAEALRPAPPGGAGRPAEPLRYAPLRAQRRRPGRAGEPRAAATSSSCRPP